MIVWISGAYGVGKSTLAEALADKVDHAVIFDAEKVGDAVRENYPDEPYGVIYEDYPLWCEFTYMLLKDIHNVFHRNILVPMTLIRRESYDRIIQRLLDDGIDTKLIVLTGTYQCIHDRILARGEEEGCWCVAVNLSDRPQESMLHLADGWRMDKVCRGDPARLLPYDGAVFHLSKI